MYAVRMENITKRFGNVAANDGVHLPRFPAKYGLSGERGGEHTYADLVRALRADRPIYVNVSRRALQTS